MYVRVCHVGCIGSIGVMGGKGGGHEGDLAVAGTIHLTTEKICVVGSVAPWRQSPD